MKRVTEDVQIRGCLVPRDSLLQTHFFSINNNVTHFEQTDTFLPERFLQSEAKNGYRDPVSQFLPFGIGPFLINHHSLNCIRNCNYTVFSTIALILTVTQIGSYAYEM